MKKKFTRFDRYCVYVLRCNDGTFYTGRDIEKRIKEHSNGLGAKCLRGKLPLNLVYAKEYSYYKRAVRREAAIKRLSHRRKEELVRIYERTRNTTEFVGVGTERRC